MKITIDRLGGTIQWTYNNKKVKIHEPNVMYAFEYVDGMIMVKKESSDDKISFSLYNVDGKFILSYSDEDGEIVVSNNKYKCLDNIISVDYSKKDNKIVVLTGKEEDNRKLIILDCDGRALSKINNPYNYTFYFTKNINNTIIAVCRGNSDKTKDKYGRNDWNFRVDLDNYYVEKLSITQ